MSSTRPLIMSAVGGNDGNVRLLLVTPDFPAASVSVMLGVTEYLRDDLSLEFGGQFMEDRASSEVGDDVLHARIC